jgi:hypothetical protein
VIASLNEWAQRAGLVTTDVESDVDFDRLVDLHRKNSLSCRRRDRNERAMDGVDRSARGERKHPVHHSVCRNRGRSQHYPGSGDARAKCASPVCDEKRRRGAADKCGTGAASSRDTAAAEIRGNTVTVAALALQ